MKLIFRNADDDLLKKKTVYPWQWIQLSSQPEEIGAWSYIPRYLCYFGKQCLMCNGMFPQYQSMNISQCHPKGNAYICTYWSRAFFGLSAVGRREPEMMSSPRKSCSTCCWYSPGLWDLATLSEFTFVYSPWREVLHHSYSSSVSYASTFLNICQFK